MKGFELSKRDLTRLVGVHPDLVRVVHHLAAFSPMPFMVIEGVRTLRRQRDLFAAGASDTLDSRHLTGHAVDLAPLVGGVPSWAWPVYYKFSPLVKQAAKQQAVPIEWGGDWWRFKDGPHWQLPWKAYPKGTK